MRSGARHACPRPVHYGPMSYTPRASFGDSGNLDGHIALIRRQLDRSMMDPETVQLAGKITSNVVNYVEDPRTGERAAVIEAWGDRFWPSGLPTPPMKNDAAELQMLWSFLVRNVRYVYDPEHADTFKTLKATLISRAGDCDDLTIAFCALARSIGFAHCYARVISMSGDSWEHIYPIIGCPKEQAQVFVPFELTVPGAKPGQEVQGYAAHRDFPMSG